MTPKEFLLARIAEDEEWAARFGCDDGHEGVGLTPRCRGRVLAECGAKRAIVESPGSECGAGGPDHYPRGHPGYPCEGCEAAEAADQSVEVVLRHLVGVYAGHPDYRGDWRP